MKIYSFQNIHIWKNICLPVLIMLLSGIPFKLPGQEITGEKRVWYPMTISFNGPEASEMDKAPNPFLDYRLQVIFTGPSGQVYNVPGFFDGDGRGGPSGNVWKVHFTANEAGNWHYRAVLKNGTGIAISTDPLAGTAVILKGQEGSIMVAPMDRNAPGFYGKGRVVHEKGSFYQKTAGDGRYWIKSGTDSPENFLAYSDFSDTPPNPDRPEWYHKYADHIKDWQQGDPTWDNGKGKGIIGALNYLSEHHVNSIYVLLMNIGGDGKDVYPFSGNIDPKGDPGNDNLHFDLAKLRQWEIVFDHAQRKEINIQAVFGEGEEANKKELDNAELGTERKLYYREMIARFSHCNALEWNISEEYDIPPFPLKPDLVMEFARYIREVDSYDHPVTVHNCYATGFDPFIGKVPFDLTSFQYYPEQKHTKIYYGYGEIAEKLRREAGENGRPIAIFFDEFCQASRKDDDAHDPTGFPFLSGQSFIRKEMIWPLFLSGDGGIEFISGDLLSLDDFRIHEPLWNYAWYARKFMEENLPLGEMEPVDYLLNNEGSGYYEDGQVFAKSGVCYAVYLPDATLPGMLNLHGDQNEFRLRWYNPRTGEFEGEEQIIQGGKDIQFGLPPSSSGDDWVVLLQKVR